MRLSKIGPYKKAPTKCIKSIYLDGEVVAIIACMKAIN